MDKVVVAVIQHLSNNPNLANVFGAEWNDKGKMTKPPRIFGYDIYNAGINTEGVTGPTELTGEPGTREEVDALSDTGKSTLMVSKNGGLTLNPLVYPRIETIVISNTIEKAWGLDNIVSVIMEQSGVVRHNGQKFGTPVMESDGIPELDPKYGWPSIFRSYLMSMVGPTPF